MTKYYFNRNGELEEVELEKWRWEAVYLDGTMLKQFDKLDEEHGDFHQFAEIDQNNLRAFRMVNQEGGVITLLFDPFKAREGKMKLVHKYRTYGRLVEVVSEENVMETQGHIQVRGYIVGFETDTYKQFFVILPSDEVVMTDNPDLVQPTIHTVEV